MSATDPQALAARLLAEAGLPALDRFEQLDGGRNNRVFRLDLASGSPVVLKCYFHDPRDTRDRLHAEWSFIDYAWANGIRHVPRALAAAPDAHAALYGFVGGRKLSRDEVGAPHVAAALDLVRRLNPPMRDLTRLPKGSEACFSLVEHLATIDRRVTRLDIIDAEAPLAEAARAFIHNRLMPLWRDVRHMIVERSAGLGFALDDVLSMSECCASPSDFGFHNALLGADGELTFIDFEYAGRDDPAKLVSDFFCQPEIPVPMAHYEGFLDGVIAALGLGETHRQRTRLLLDAYRIKWLCIMLNDFLPMDAARRAFAETNSRAERCARQLERAMQESTAIGRAADIVKV